jgi:hypothetical protein
MMRHDQEVTSPAATPTQLSCAGCDTAVDELPMTWTIENGSRGVEYLCPPCTRSSVRQIESQLPAEWW